MIRRAGGLPVLAHPSFITSVEGILPSLLAEGLGGIEVYYPDHTPLQVQYFKDLAARHGLVVTGGSDFHGPAYREGCHLGGMSMTAEEVEALFSAGITKGAC
jgi:predicted metal-dependent phosphoesterase TrpH